jgi:hypothetical protein
MTDLNVAFNGGRSSRHAAVSAKLPDLFKGDTLLLFGKYRGTGPPA